MAQTKVRGSSQIVAASIKPAQIDLSQAFTFAGAVVFSSTATAQTPSSDSQIATKSYVDNVAAGIDIHDAVDLTTKQDILISGAAYAPSGGAGGTGNFTGVDLTDTDYFDSTGHSIIVGTRILIKDQSDAKQNGIYAVTTSGVSGVIERAEDADGNPTSEITTGDFVFVIHGTDYASTGWVISTDNSSGGYHALNTDDITWTQFSGSGTYTADDTTLALTGTVFSIKDGGVSNTQVNASAAIVESKLSLDYATATLNTAIGLNTSHKDGSGSDHADVATNTTHTGGDGSDHADVATNTTHISSDGSDHTFLDQSVVQASSPTFVGLTLTDNIDTASGKGVSWNSDAVLISSDNTDITFKDGRVSGGITLGQASSGTALTGTFTATSIVGALNELRLDLDTSSGDVTDVIGGNGISDSGSGGDITVAIDLASNSGLTATGGTGDQLAVDSGIAGNGLTIGSGILAIGEGNGMSVTADAIAVDVSSDGGLIATGGTGAQLEIKPDTTSTTTSEANAAIIGTNGLSVKVDDATIEGSQQGSAGAESIRVKANGIDANELNVSGNGTSGQILSSDADGSFTWIDNDTGDVTDVVGGDGLVDSGSGGSIELDVDLAANSGLTVAGGTGAQLALDPSVDGNGLDLTAGVLTVDVNAAGAISNNFSASGEVGVLVDDSSIAISGNALIIKALGVDTAELAATAVTAAKLGSDVAGDGIGGGNGSALTVDFVREFDMSINYTNDTVTLSNSPVAGSELVFKNGILQNPGASDDYQISDTVVTFNVDIESGDTVAVWYLK